MPVKEFNNIISIRLDDELNRRIEREKTSENRRATSEMARILIAEALDVREARAKKKR